MNRPSPRKKRGQRAHLPEPSDVASLTEFTGLMQTPPRTGEEWEAYRTLLSADLTDGPYWHRPE